MSEWLALVRNDPSEAADDTLRKSLEAWLPIVTRRGIMRFLGARR